MGINGDKLRKDFFEKYRVNQAEIRKIPNNVTNMEEYLFKKGRVTGYERDKAVREMEEYLKALEEKKRIKRQRNGRKRKLAREKANKNHKTFRGKIKKRIALLALAGVTLIGGFAIAQNKQANESINLGQAIAYGESIDNLGIDNNIVSEIEEIDALLANKENLTNQEIIALSKRINDLQFDNIKTKISNTLGVTEDKIRLHTSPIEENNTKETVEITDGETYRNKDIFTYENTIPSEISDYIKEIGEMQGVMQQLQVGNFNREEILKTYERMMENTDKFAAYKMSIDEKGNFSVEKIPVSALNQQKDQTKTATLEQQQNNGEERD